MKGNNSHRMKLGAVDIHTKHSIKFFMGCTTENIYIIFTVQQELNMYHPSIQMQEADARLARKVFDLDWRSNGYRK